MAEWQNDLIDPIPWLKNTVLFFFHQGCLHTALLAFASYLATEIFFSYGSFARPATTWRNGCCALSEIVYRGTFPKILQRVLFYRKHLFSRCRLADELRRSLFWVTKVWMCASHFWSLLRLTKTHQCYAYSLRFFPSRKDAWVCLEEMRSICR